MPGFRIDTFAGEVPRLDPHKLQAGQAKIAKDIRLWSGRLEAMAGLGTVQAATTAGTPKTIFQYRPDGTWFEWDAKVNAVHSPVPDDQYERVMYTGVGAPKVTSAAQALSSTPYPAAAYDLGVPAPSSKPTGSISGTSNEAADTRFYVVTYVNSWAEEGPPSPVSDEFEVKPGQDVALDLPSAPSGNYDVTLVRIYRTNTGANNAAFQYVGEAAIGTATFTDSLASSALGEVMPTTDWDPPPSDLEGLVSLPGGTLAGFRGNQVLFSVPGVPHAWPTKYRHSVDYPIVGLGVLPNGVVILTKGQPYSATGSHPAGYALTRIRKPYACTSAEGIVSLDGAVIYPSPHGLVMAGARDAQLLTETIFDRDDWQALTPSSIKAFEWRGLYLAFYNNGADGAFVTDARSPNGGIVTFSGNAVECGYSAPEDGKVYLAVAGNITEWDAGNALTYTYRSRPIQVAAPTLLKVIQVFANSYPVTIKLYRNGSLQSTVDVGSDTPRRLPGPERGREFEVEVSAATEVYEIAVATSMDALKNV